MGDDGSGLTAKVKDEPNSPSRFPSPTRVTPEKEKTIVEDAINVILDAKKVIEGNHSEENVSS